MVGDVTYLLYFLGGVYIVDDDTGIMRMWHLSSRSGCDDLLFVDTVAMNGYNKTAGYVGEIIVKQRYEQQGYQCQAQNFTIRGGELDLVMSNPTHLVVVEVKVVNYVDQLHDYITPKKLQALQKTIQTYLWKHPTHKIVQLDVVFVRQGKIIHVIPQVEI